MSQSAMKAKCVRLLYGIYWSRYLGKHVTHPGKKRAEDICLVETVRRMLETERKRNCAKTLPETSRSRYTDCEYCGESFRRGEDDICTRTRVARKMPDQKRRGEEPKSAMKMTVILKDSWMLKTRADVEVPAAIPEWSPALAPLPEDHRRHQRLQQLLWRLQSLPGRAAGPRRRA